ncbi:transposase [Aspergillus chevalieri]|uniref:HTH CENPB-type domain-containing protein n=1 Tax=Aspergillus chevalieri TaxID=182096 RepID=A0A7R7VJR8_ASPCH|nr:uncharacterized protein ACHE_20606A [Aspergillus chevalieri]BCR85148.1 hypothetical protein ACHE_20606A [Aspergillus chevalieri]
MPTERENIEEQIKNAIATYERDKSQKIRPLAEAFDVPYQRLLRRVKGLPGRNSTKPVNYALDKHQENALKHWIERLDQAGVPPTAKRIEKSANLILQRAHTDPTIPPKKVSKEWPYRFLERLGPEYTRLKQRPKDPKRLQSQDLGIIQNWYDRLEILLKQYQIQPQDLYNFDEIGFMEGQGRGEVVITKYPSRAQHPGASFSRGLISVVECISADGSVLPPCIILPGKGHLEDWYTHSDMPGNWILGVSPNGYISDEIAFEWIKHFDKHTKQRCAGVYRLLLMDNHGSHLTYEFIEYCEKNRILLYSFPPHATHFLQPLDGKPFKQYKHYHGQAVTEAAILGWSDFEKREFLTVLPGIRKETFKTHTIQSAFRDCGIFPFDPSPVMDDLEKQAEPIPDLQIWDGDSISSGSAQSSPKTIRQLRKEISKARASLDKIDGHLSALSPGLNRRLERIFSGGLTQAESSDQTAMELDRYLKAAAHQSKPKSRRQVPGLSHSGVLSVQDANRRIGARKKAEEKKEGRRLGQSIRTSLATTHRRYDRLELWMMGIDENADQETIDSILNKNR